MTSTRDRNRFHPGLASLWASAFVLIGMVLLQAGRMGHANEARADVAVISDLTVMNARAGDRDDIVVILDQRAETLFVYGADAARKVNLYETHNISELFSKAKQEASR